MIKRVNYDSSFKFRILLYCQELFLATFVLLDHDHWGNLRGLRCKGLSTVKMI